jgi:hypothetical protein
MKHFGLLAICFAVSACASTARHECADIAPASEGWRPIAAPVNAAALLDHVGEPSDRAVIWYRQSSESLRACVPDGCKSLGYDFVREDQLWTGGVNVLTLCHEAKRPN